MAEAKKSTPKGTFEVVVDLPVPQIADATRTLTFRGLSFASYIAITTSLAMGAELQLVMRHPEGK